MPVFPETRLPLEKAGLYIVRQIGNYVILEQNEGSQGGAEMYRQGLLRQIMAVKLLMKWGQRGSNPPISTVL